MMRFGGSDRPEAWSAARTRSRLSATALSGRPTMANMRHAGRDLHLDVDGDRLDPLKRDRGDVRNHRAPAPLQPTYGR